MQAPSGLEGLAALSALDVEAVQDAGAREAIMRLMGLVEQLAAENRSLRATIERLEAEMRRLKGQSPRPPMGKGSGSPRQQNISSERERHTPKEWSKGSKLHQLQVDREETLTIDPAELPSDAVFKGSEAVVVQDVVVRTDTVRFWKEKWYSPSEGRTYLAPLPAGYHGAFGPGLKALVTVLYFGVGASEPRIVELLRNVGIVISDGQVSNLLIKRREPFHEEARAVQAAGLASSPWQHLDTTATSLAGKPQHCHVLTNPLYTAYDTRPAKDRLTVVDVLAGWQNRQFLLNDEALAYLERMGMSPKRRAAISRLPRDVVLNEATLQEHLDTLRPALGVGQTRRVKEALAIAAYHAHLGHPVVTMLVCDDAHQFDWVTDELALCWIHEGRHYAKLSAVLAQNADTLTDFKAQFWDYYRALNAYRANPTEVERRRLDNAFDALFTRRTGFAPLDERIQLTYAKKAQLLAALTHPEVPLHNNPAELGARRRVRKRDVSFGAQHADGLRAWDTFQTLAATAQKLNVSFYHYMLDRVSEAHTMPPLAELISQRALGLNLGSSWVAS